MTSHEEWFQDMREPERPCYDETGDDLTHPIQHIRDVPFSHSDKMGYIKNIMYVSMKLWKIVSWINKLSNKELKFGSTKEVSSLGIRVDLSLMDVEKVDCSSST